MDFLQQALTLLITLAILIAFHEYGHFIVARRCGVKVLRFSIGFGPVLLRWFDKRGTEFAISALPLGGYVKMLDEREAEVAEHEQAFAFNRKTPMQRIAIASAGPIANFILAIFVYWLVFLQGTTGLLPQLFNVAPNSIAAQAGLQQGLQVVAVDQQETATVKDVVKALTQRIGETGVIQLTAKMPDTDIAQTYHLSINAWLRDADDQVDILSSLGLGFYQPKVSPIAAEIMPQSAAEQAGMLAGDQILSMDGIMVEDWQQWVAYVQQKPATAIALTVLRNEQPIDLVITPKSITQNGKQVGQVGIRVDVPVVPDHLIVKKHYSLVSAWLPAVGNTWDMTVFSLVSLKKILLGDLSYKQLSGPISIAKVVNQSAYYGFYSYLSLLALLSVSLAVLNLLPIPVLDGGHIVFCVIEMLRGGREVPEKIQIVALQLGMFIVLSVMLLAVFNDLGRL